MDKDTDKDKEKDTALVVKKKKLPKSIEKNFNVLRGFFKNQSHFVNYCMKIWRSKTYYAVVDVSEEELRNIFMTFAWTVIHEDEFIDRGIKPPFKVLIDSLKVDDNGDFFINTVNELMPEISDLILNKIKIEDCVRVCSHEMTYGISDYLSYFYSGYSQEFVELLVRTTGKCGVYRLYDSKKVLLYIGKSYDLGARIKGSAKEQRAVYVDYSRTLTRADANLLEVYLISKAKPPNNKDIYTFDDLTFELNIMIRFTKMVKIFNNG